MSTNKTKTKKKIETITLGHDEDSPSISLCPGHVSPKTFAKAFAAEGWDPSDEPAQEDLRYEYWRRVKSGGYKKCLPFEKGAKPFTTSEW